MDDFHFFLNRLLVLWLGLYVAVLTLMLAKPVALFLMAGFKLSPTGMGHLLGILHLAVLWLIPTLFLWLAATFSRPYRKI